MPFLARSRVPASGRRGHLKTVDRLYPPGRPLGSDSYMPLGARLAALDVFRMRNAGADVIGRRQERRFRDLLGYVRSYSPFYQEYYARVPDPVRALAALPVVTKQQLMARFDDVVTDRTVTRREVDAFLADPKNIGFPFHGRYQVATSSGSTGHPGVFVLDELARALSVAIPRIRGGLTSWYGPRQTLRFVRSGRRYALIDVGGGPYGAVTSLEWARREHSRTAKAMRFVSVLDPLDRQVTELNEFRPRALGGYPSAIFLLAREQAAARLRIDPLFIILVGETVTGPTRQFIEATFRCRTYEEYGTTENGVIAIGCSEGWLHANTDWYILEPVDAEYQPVPPGTLSHTVLVSNLANRVMPFIRYDQGDSVLVRPDRCPCGSAFPALRVQGRTDDMLELPAAGDKSSVTLPPLGIVTLIEEAPDVYRVQVVQQSPSMLEIRLQLASGTNSEAVWAGVAARVRGYLDDNGIGDVAIVCSSEPPMRHPTSGKYAQVIKQTHSATHRSEQ